MSSLAAIRAGLVTNLNTLKTSYQDMQISPYYLSNSTLPVIMVNPTAGSVTEYHQAMQNGLETWSMTVYAFIAGGVNESQQMWLDELLATTGPHSVKAAIEADKTLGGVANDLIVRRCIAYAAYQRVDGTACYGAEWLVEVS